MITIFLSSLVLVVAFVASAIIYGRQRQNPEVVPGPGDAPEPETPPVAPVPLPNPNPPVMPTKTHEFYELSKSLLGQHLSLNNAVPFMVGCAEAVSDLMHRFGIAGIPKAGIQGTAQMLYFLEESKDFDEIDEYEPGAVIVSATGTGNGKIRGHVGICGEHQIMSNNSETGKWDTQWTWERWHSYYRVYGGIPTRFFRLRG